MSAFILIAAHQQSQRLQEKLKPKKPRKIKDDNKHDNGSMSSRSSQSTVSRSGSSMKYKTNKRFDMNTNSYITLTPVELKLERYREKLNKVVARNGSAADNRVLNLHCMKDGTQLFSSQNIAILRYSFFELLCSDYNYITKETKKRVNGVLSVRYARKLEDMKHRRKLAVTGLPRFLDSGDEVSFDSGSEDDRISAWSAPYSLRQIHDSYSIDHDRELERNTSVRELLKSNHFFNNVYQDLKYNEIEFSSQLSFFELLPNLRQLASFYKEVIEYALMNLQVLQCDTKGLTEEEKATLQKHKYVYYEDYHYEWFHTMNKVYNNLFDSQRKRRCSMGTPYAFDPQQMYLQEELTHHIVRNFIDNFRVFVEIPERQELYDLWESFLNFVIIELIVNSRERTTSSNSPTVQNSTGTRNTKPSNLTIAADNKPRDAIIYPHTTNESLHLEQKPLTPTPPQTPTSMESKKRTLFSRFKQKKTT